MIPLAVIGLLLLAMSSKKKSAEKTTDELLEAAEIADGAKPPAEKPPAAKPPAAKPPAAKPPAAKPPGEVVVDIGPATLDEDDDDEGGDTDMRPAPVEAARALAQYAAKALASRDGAALGLKNAPSGVVAQHQSWMGGITPDGIYGPATRARGSQLGVAMPARK